MNYKRKDSFYPWKDQLAKDTYEETKKWHLLHWKEFRNVFWETYYQERENKVGFRRRKLGKIKEFNRLKAIK